MSELDIFHSRGVRNIIQKYMELDAVSEKRQHVSSNNHSTISNAVLVLAMLLFLFSAIHPNKSYLNWVLYIDDIIQKFVEHLTKDQYNKLGIEDKGAYLEKYVQLSFLSYFCVFHPVWYWFHSYIVVAGIYPVVIQLVGLSYEKY